MQDGNSGGRSQESISILQVLLSLKGGDRETKKACDQNALDPSTCVCAQSHVQNCLSVPPTSSPERQDRTPTADTCDQGVLC